MNKKDKKQAEKIDDMTLIKCWSFTHLNKLVKYTIRRDNINDPQRHKIKKVLLRHARLVIAEIKHIIAKKDR